jgi:predicted DNA-binding WGR domain protein
MFKNYNIFKNVFSKNTLLDKEDFVAALLNKMKKETQYPSPAYKEKAGEIYWGENKFYMGNIYEDYSRSSPKEAKKFISTTFERFKIMMRNQDDDVPPFEEIISILLPSIRSRLYLETMQEHGKFPFRLMNDFVGVCISLNTEISIILPQQSYFETWGKDFDEVFNYAIQNLEAINEGGYEEIYPGVWRSMWKDGTDPSRILQANYFWDMDVKGDPVIFIPHREVLLVTGSEDKEGLEKALDFCEEYHGLNHSISAFLYTPVEMENGSYRLELFTVPNDHPLYERISELRGYAFEKECLALHDYLLEKEDKEYEKKQKKKNEIGPFLNFYKENSNHTQYWNARIKDLQIIINHGTLNSLGTTQVMECSSKNERDSRLEAELTSIKAQGYLQWDLKNAKSLYIKFRLTRRWEGTSEDLDKKYALIDLMDHYLSKIGFGYCADGEREDHFISILCVVLNSFSRTDDLVQVLKENDLLEGITITTREGGEDKIIWGLEES